MRASLAIGDFSRATHLSIKTLRHYHRVGLLEPADVDPDTGHRRYTTEQIPTAQVIRRFRSLDMPLEEIHAVIAAPDLATRNELIAGHLGRLEATLARTQQATASLRDLLQPPVHAAPVTVEHRQVAATPAAAVREVIDADDGVSWLQGALGELYATLAAQKRTPSGPSGGVFANDLFTHERGEATVFVPCGEPIRPTGRVAPLTVPNAELAVTRHVGDLSDVDLAYGSLAAYVADHALGVEGPLREYYVVGPHETAEETLWRTEIGWPIFHTGGAKPETD
jgi:DNA-binding transcriptional MerR regulator